MFKYLIILIFVALLFSCKDSSVESDGNSSFLIYGNMQEGAGYQLLIKKIYAKNLSDSLVIEIAEDGSFQESVHLDSEDFFSIINAAGNAITLFCEPGDSIKLEANYYDFREYKLSGNRESEQISFLNTATQNFLKQIANFSSIIEDSIDSPNYVEIRMNIDKKYKEEFRKLKSFSENFIAENEGSLISLLALSNQLGKNFFVFHPVADKEIFYSLDSALFSKYPLYEPVENLHLQVINLKKVNIEKPLFKIGDELPILSLADTSGIILNLQTLRGKIVFIDIWASWCKSCRNENLKYLELYKLYRKDNFEIIQISLDDSEKDWKLAIDQDKLPWLHVSDLKEWDSKAVSMLDIKELPSNFLLNQRGEIIAKDIDAEKLRTQLKMLIINK